MSNATGTYPEKPQKADKTKSLKKQTRLPAYASDKPGGRNKQTSIPEQANGSNAKFHRDETQIRSRQNPNTMKMKFSI